MKTDSLTSVQKLPTLPPILHDVTPPPFQHPDPEEAEASSLDNSYLTADEGYEADAEVVEHLSDGTENTAMNLESHLSMSQFFPQQNFKSSSFSKPELCCLVVSLLVQLHENSDDGLNPSLVHALQKLSSLCRDSPQNCVTLTNHGVIASLLSGKAENKTWLFEFVIVSVFFRVFKLSSSERPR